MAAESVIVQCGLSNRSGEMSCSLCRKSCSLCGKIYSLCKKSFAERVRNFRVPFSRDFKVSLKHCFLLQQEGVRGPLRHRCQDHAHQQPSVKREVIFKKITILWIFDGPLPTIQKRVDESTTHDDKTSTTHFLVPFSPLVKI